MKCPIPQGVIYGHAVVCARVRLPCSCEVEGTREAPQPNEVDGYVSGRRDHHLSHQEVAFFALAYLQSS